MPRPKPVVVNERKFTFLGGEKVILKAGGGGGGEGGDVRGGSGLQRGYLGPSVPSHPLSTGGGP